MTDQKNMLEYELKLFFGTKDELYEVKDVPFLHGSMLIPFSFYWAAQLSGGYGSSSVVANFGGQSRTQPEDKCIKRLRFNFTNVHVPGNKHVGPDIASRYPGGGASANMVDRP